MEELDEDVRETCLQCREALQKLQGHLQPLFAMPRADLKHLPPTDAARLNIALSFAVVNLFHMYLRTQGQRPAPDHPIHHEARRVHQYLEKLREATDDSTRRTLVDTAATGRLLVHILGRDGSGRATKKKKKRRETPAMPADPPAAQSPTASASQGFHTTFIDDDAEPAVPSAPCAQGTDIPKEKEGNSEGDTVEVEAPPKRQRALASPAAAERRKKRSGLAKAR